MLGSCEARYPADSARPRTGCQFMHISEKKIGLFSESPGEWPPAVTSPLIWWLVAAWPLLGAVNYQAVVGQGLRLESSLTWRNAVMYAQKGDKSGSYSNVAKVWPLADQVEDRGSLFGIKGMVR